MKFAMMLFSLLLFASACKETSMSSGSDVLSQEKALEIAQAHVQDRSAVWSAELVKDQEIEFNNVITKHTVWVVKAVFPYGNKEIYQIDALSGELLVLTETEAPMKEEVQQPSPSPSVIPALAPLEVRLVERPDGFAYKLTKDEGTNTMVAQSFISPDSSMPVVHLVRRIIDAPDIRRFTLDVVTANPKEKAFKTFSLANVLVKDSYSVDSVARAYGFMDPKHLALVVPVEGDTLGSVRYNIVSLHIQTGEVTTLIEGIPPDLSPDFFARNWLNKAGNKLYLNSYSGGKVWIADLRARTVKSLDGSFKHTWPIFQLFYSPDGERFWYEKEGFQLYDGEGVKLASLPKGQGFHSYPSFQWSPDSRYAAYEYTLDESQENVLGGEDAILIAPEGIKVYDRTGKLVWQKANNKAHVEWSGWLAEGQMIMRSYGLERADGQPPRKIGSSYSLINVETGQISALSPSDHIEELNKPELAYGKGSQLLFVDAEKGRYWIGSDGDDDHGQIMLLSKPDYNQLVWAEFNYDKNETTVNRYDPMAKKIVTTRWNETPGYQLQLYGEDMVFDAELNYRYLN